MSTEEAIKYLVFGHCFRLNLAEGDYEIVLTGSSATWQLRHKGKDIYRHEDIRVIVGYYRAMKELKQ